MLGTELSIEVPNLGAPPACDERSGHIFDIYLFDTIEAPACTLQGGPGLHASGRSRLARTASVRAGDEDNRSMQVMRITGVCRWSDS